METKTNPIDYKVIRHADVFLLMPQNDEARDYLETYRFSYDIYGEGACVETPFNQNGGLIMRPEYLQGWVDCFEGAWSVSYEV